MKYICSISGKSLTPSSSCNHTSKLDMYYNLLQGKSKNIQTDYTLGTLVIFPLIGLWARKSNGGNSDANGQLDITTTCPFCFNTGISVLEPMGMPILKVSTIFIVKNNQCMPIWKIVTLKWACPCTVVLAHGHAHVHHYNCGRTQIVLPS